MPRDKNLPAHHVEKGDSRIDGPYLDDINAARDAAYKNSKVGKKFGSPAAKKATEKAVKKTTTKKTAAKKTAAKKKTTAKKKAK